MQNNNSILKGLISNSSNFLLTALILSFFLMFGVQMFYYADSFKDVVPQIGFAYGIGIAIGLFTQLCRLAFGLAGAFEFASGKYGKGAGGLLFSFCITLFEAFEVQGIAMEWGAKNAHLEHSLLILFQFLIWTGFFLELRLAMNVSAGELFEPETEGQPVNHSVVFSTTGANGSAKKKPKPSRS